MNQKRSLSVSVTNTTKRRFPLFPYNKIKNVILGKRYELSLAFVGVSRMKRLNKTYRRKEGATDVLSFSVGKGVGEIVIAQEVSDRKAKKFNESHYEYLLRLFIHGCLHLKGYAHGSTMERYEQRIKSRFLFSTKGRGR